MARQMCQSCSMPLKADNRGTEKDGSPSSKYCKLCYGKGKFLDPDLSLEQMQKIVVDVLKKKHWPGFMANYAAKQIPKLERWQTK